MTEENAGLSAASEVERKSLAAVLVAAAIACLACAAFATVALSVDAGPSRTSMESWFEAAAAGLAAAGVCFAALRSGFWAWRWIALAAILFFASDIVAVAFEVQRGVYLGIGVVQALDLLSLGAFLWGVCNLPQDPLSWQAQRRIALDSALAMAGAMLVLWLFVVGPMEASNDSIVGRGTAFMLYSLFSLTLFWALLRLFFTKAAQTPRRIIHLLGIGAGTLSLATVVYMVSLIRSERGLLSFAALGVTLSLLSLGLAGALQGIQGRRAPQPPASPSNSRWPALSAVTFSAVCVALAFLVLYQGHLDRLGQVAFAIVLVITMLFIVRQAISLREEAALRARLQDAHDDLETKVTVRTKELDRKLREVTTLSLAADIAARAEDEATLIAETTNLVQESLFSDICGVLLVDPEAQLLRSAVSFHWEAGPREVPAIPLGKGITGKVALTGKARRVRDTASEPDYLGLDSRVRSELCVPIRIGEDVIGVFNAESRQPDAFSESDLWVLNALASQMAVALSRLRSAAAAGMKDARFRALIQHTEELITVHEPTRPFAFQSPSVQRIMGYSPDELDGKDPLGLVHPDDLGIAKAAMARAFKREPQPGPVEFRIRRKDGAWIYLENYPSNLIADPAVKGIVLNSRDITARKSDESRIHRQLERLKALHAIDSAIGATSDLKHTLQVVLEQVLAQLGADAACVLLLDEATQSFRLGAGQGFRAESPQHPRQRVGDSFAGRAVEGRRVVQIPDLLTDAAAFAHSPLFREEMFVAYFAAPLLAKNRVVGVLEVFHRAPLHPDVEWINFLEILAGQTAAAIENASLLENLHRSNADLSRAYDTTLLGWSRALEMRDRETQGHTERVTNLTVGLSRLAGIPEPEILHVRWGALLHDIGKMGIPDAILLKSGPLTPKEWITMKRHVEYARDLLSPINFLKPALDIPCGHHERWDGSGYPLGLKGEAIPLSARVFAIVDNWDALSSDRPYRGAWPPDKVRAYLKEQSGSLFDPRLVDLFLGMEIEDAGVNRG